MQPLSGLLPYRTKGGVPPCNATFTIQTELNTTKNTYNDWSLKSNMNTTNHIYDL